MARPLKNNADYFSHDNDMRNDERIKAVRRRFKHEGYSVWNMLLEKFCKAEDFTLKYNDVTIELWAGDFEIEPEKLKEILEYFLKINLITELEDMIFSETLIKRFNGLLNKRKRKKDLLSTSETPNIGVMDVHNTQSKVKESKVKYLIEPKLISELRIEDCKLKKDSLEFKVIESSVRLFEGFKKIFPLNKDLDRIEMIDWIPHVRVLIADKNYTYDQIREVINWAMEDKFWKTTIVDAKTLEKNFEKLKLKYHGQPV
jgi:hypothetical protein